MGKTKGRYPPECRAEADRLVHSGRQSVAQIARDVGVADESLRSWVKQADVAKGRRVDGLTTAERDEVRRVRRENRVV